MFKRSIILNLLIMMIVGVSGFLLLVWSLGYYTRHGESAIIPSVKGKQLSEAIDLLRDADLEYEVVDSVYDKLAIPNTIIEVYPGAGETVKPGRIIFLKIYASAPPRIPVPHIKDMSARQAYALLRGLGFESISEKAVVGEYMGLCQGLTLANGQTLKAGDLISRDTRLVLLVTGRVQLDSVRLDDLLAADSLASASSALSVGDSTIPKKNVPQEPVDEPQPEPENFW